MDRQTDNAAGALMRILAQEAEWQRVCVLLIGLRDRGPVSQALPES